MARASLTGTAVTAAAVVVLATGCGLVESDPESGGTPSPTASVQTSTPAQTESTPSDTESAPESSGLSTVAAEDYLRGGDPASAVYVFTSPSENLACGIDPAGSSGSYAGCHALSTVANLPECDDPDSNGPWVHISAETGTVEAACQREGVFFESSAQVLDYGQTLEVEGTSCTSAEEGVSCSRGAEAFRASRAQFGPVGAD